MTEISKRHRKVVSRELTYQMQVPGPFVVIGPDDCYPESPISRCVVYVLQGCGVLASISRA